MGLGGMDRGHRPKVSSSTRRRQTVNAAIAWHSDDPVVQHATSDGTSRIAAVDERLTFGIIRLIHGLRKKKMNKRIAKADFADYHKICQWVWPAF
jgi:hypothetical protein